MKIQNIVKFLLIFSNYNILQIRYLYFLKGQNINLSFLKKSFIIKTSNMMGASYFLSNG